MRNCNFAIKILGTILFPFLLSSLASAQVIDGIDYSSRKDVSNTFDMARTDVFGQRFPSENFTFRDKETGVEINALTTSRRFSSKMYQTHPQWTPDMKYIVFFSRFTGPRAEGMRGQVYAVSMENYEIVQITTGDWGRGIHLGWKKNVAYIFRENQLMELNLGKLLADSEKDQVGEPVDYERVIAALPDGIRPGGMGLDARENRVFFSSGVGEDSTGIFCIDFSNGKTSRLMAVPFRIGHLQCNPFVTGEVMYCWETGGDAPQRIWYMTLREDGSVENRPLYKEKDSDWVTHEIFAGPDHVLFHIMGHLDRLRKNPTGIFSINIRTNETKFHGQTGGGGYWHCGGTQDFKWVVGDTFDGKLFRINLEDNDDVRLLTTGHRGISVSPFTNEAHLHPSISPDGKWVLINSSLLTDSDIMLVPLFPEEE